MTDKELADKVVALGVGSGLADCYLIDAFSQTAHRFVRDWRVAGALIERLNGPGLNEFARKVIVTTGSGSLYPNEWTLHQKIQDPRAIVEVCVAALTTPESTETT